MRLFQINFVDYGTCIDVHVNHVKYLLKKFADVPINSVRGCLSGIQPISERWTLESTRKFAQMVQDKCLFADVLDYDMDVSIHTSIQSHILMTKK